jgi:hypothetical protein
MRSGNVIAFSAYRAKYPADYQAHWATGNREWCFSCASAGKKFHRPFGYAPLFYVNVLAGRWFYYVLLLQDQSEWFFSAREFCRKTESSRVGGECVVIIVSVVLIRCSVLRVTPYAVLQDSVPYKPSSRFANCRILAYPGRIDRPGESCSLLHDLIRRQNSNS